MKTPFCQQGITGFLLLLLIFLFSGNSLAGYAKTKIAVLDFRLQGSDFSSQDMGSVVSEWLITAFVKNGRFEVIERRLLGQIMEEQKMTEVGLVSNEGAVELGKLLGVKVIISGSVIKLGNVTEVNARIIDVQDGSIIAAENIQSSSLTQLHAQVDSMAAKIIKNFPLEGYVVYRKGENLDIDLGRHSGVHLDMRFTVLKEGEAIKHPKTGKVLYVKQIRLGTIKVTKVRKKTSTAVVIDEAEGQAIEYGNKIKSINDDSGTSTIAATPRIDANQSSSIDRIRLVVDAEPGNARIRILNIAPKYRPGIELRPGDYRIEVSARGYSTQTFWKTLSGTGEHVVSVKLLKGGPQTTAIQVKDNTHVASASASSEEQRVIRRLRSNDPNVVRRTARVIYKSSHLRTTAVLDVVSHQLLKGYRRPGSSIHIDAMAWLANILGISARRKYLDTLDKASTSTNRKIQKFASKNYRALNRSTGGISNSKSGFSGFVNSITDTFD